MPKGIFVEDFEKLNVGNSKMYGFCNLQPSRLIKKSDEIIPSRVLYFNNFNSFNRSIPDNCKWLSDWAFVSEIADAKFLTGQAATDFFLDLFIHEFSHVMHEDRLLKKMSGEKLAKVINSIKNEAQIKKYQNIFGAQVSQICEYALTDPFEAIACDMTKKIIQALNQNTLLPQSNPFINTAYERISLIKRFNNLLCKKTLSEILRNFWNGKFDYINKN